MESVKTNRRLTHRHLLTKVLIILLLFVLCCLSSFTVGYAGGFVGFNTAVRSAYFPSMVSMAFVLLVWGIVAVYRNFSRSLLAALLGFLVVTTIASILVHFKLLNLISNHALLTFSYTILGLLLCTANLFSIRFAIALIDILLIASQPLKIGILLIVSAASLLGGNAAATALKLTVPGDQYITQAIARLTEAQINTATTVATATGLVFGLTLSLGAWQANLRQGAPWRYPDLLRDWALAIGSFGGPSFRKSDLSGMDFRGVNLANTDLRATTLHRTCFQGSRGLERARVNSEYLDLERPQVQKLLTQGRSDNPNFRGLNLQGAYLQNADMRGFDLTGTNLTGADLQGADLRESCLARTQLAGANLQGVDLRKNVFTDANLTEAHLQKADLRDSLLIRAQIARADFTNADLTGACIEDWSVSSQTRFTQVRCDYIYLHYRDQQPCDRYPVDRDFEAGEFASLYQRTEDVVELIFKGDFNFGALSLAFYKLQTEVPELELELKGIEQRENLWVVRVKSSSASEVERIIQARFSSVYQATSSETAVEAVIKDAIYRDYEDIKERLADSEQLVKHLAGVTKDQAEALKELSKRALGNSFFITGSTITNLAGSGQIEYNEAADQVRSVVTGSDNPHQVVATLRSFLNQVKGQNVATTASTQLELIQQLILSEAEKDPTFKQFLVQQGQQIVGAMPNGAIAKAVEQAIAALTP